MSKRFIVADDQEQETNPSSVIPQSLSINPIQANRLKQQSKITQGITFVSDLTNVYRLVQPGLMLEGTCRTPSCYAYNKKALHCFGFIKDLNFSKAIDAALCRLCNKRLNEVNNIGYYQAVIKINGRYVNSEDPIERVFRADDDKYHSFKNTKEQQQTWAYLEITAEPLQKSFLERFFGYFGYK